MALLNHPSLDILDGRSQILFLADPLLLSRLAQAGDQAAQEVFRLHLGCDRRLGDQHAAHQRAQDPIVPWLDIQVLPVLASEIRTACPQLSDQDIRQASIRAYQVSVTET